MQRKTLAFATLITLTFILMFGTVASNAFADKVIIEFTQQPGPVEEALVRNAGGIIKYTYHLVPAIAADVPGLAIAQLRANRMVTHVHPDGKVQALDTELDNSWGVKRIGAGVVHGYNKGTGVKVAVVDTGIDYNHSDLDANYAGGYDFVNSDTEPMDDNGHGTHVAGTVGAEDNDVGVVGVAPEVALYALKVLDESGSGYWSDVIAAIEWATDPNGDGDTSDHLDVTNNSYGSDSDPGSTVKSAFDNAYQIGVLHVAAAGNSGNPPGKGDNVGYPARYDSVIAVAATDKNDKRARWSSTGPDVELSAPGVDINSTLLGGGYGEKSGTSMASPHVAGTVALVWVAYPDWTNADVRTQLQDTADYLGDSNLYGYGLVDADEAAPLTDTTPPAKVTGLSVTTVSCAQLDLAWDANTETDLDHYNVYRSTTSGGPYDLIASPTTNSYSDVGLTASTTYYYVVSAVDTSGNEGEKSDEASGTTSADDLGPVTSNVVADPNPTNGATSVTLTADVSDSTTGNSNITAAEYFVDTVGADGSGTPMSASDGTFDSPTEGVTADIDVSGWAVGQYTLYVHGQDAAGNWGTTESVVLDVTEAPTGNENDMYVWDMVPSTKPGRVFTDVMVTVTIRRDSDADGVAEDSDELVSQARVEMLLERGSDSWKFAGDTDASGEVTFKLKTTSPDGDYKATIQDVDGDGVAVSHDIYTYNPNLDVKSSITFTVTDKNIASTVVAAPAETHKTQLLPTYPNPINPDTWIPFTLSAQARVLIKIYNVTGRLVRTLDLGSKQAGAYVSRDNAAYWDGKNANGEKVSSGVYFYLMEAGKFRAMKKMVVMK